MFRGVMSKFLIIASWMIYLAAMYRGMMLAIAWIRYWMGA